MACSGIRQTPLTVGRVLAFAKIQVVPRVNYAPRPVGWGAFLFLNIDIIKKGMCFPMKEKLQNILNEALAKIGEAGADLEQIRIA